MTQKRTKYYFPFVFEKNTNSVAILSQVRLIDACRLGYKIGEISEEAFKLLKDKIKALLP